MINDPSIQREAYNATPTKPKEAEKPAVEPASTKDGDEGYRDRVAREREERTKKQELRNFARKQADPGRSPKFANPKRQEEAVKRFNTQLDAPAPKPVQQKVEKGGVGDGIEFYCYQNGEVGKMVILTESGFTRLPL